MTMLLKFERTTCSRCGGTGQYSYNQVDGSRCYGCQGQGQKLTKRGSKAYKFWQDSRKVKASELNIGDKVAGLGYKQFTVCEMVQDTESTGKSLQSDGSWKPHAPSLHLYNSKGAGLTVPPDYELERLPKTEAERVALLMAAFEYQDTLS